MTNTLMEQGVDSSERLFRRAARVSPGGVHGASRFYSPHPRFWQRMEGQYVWDVEGKRYLDLSGTWGTAALGHNHPAVRAAVIHSLENEGVHFGPPSRREVELSETLVRHISCAERVALFGGGGSDPLYVGFRLARSATGRRRLLKFEGEYHGWHDPLAVSVHPRLEDAGPRDRPCAVPVSSGADEGSCSAVIGILNDHDLLDELFTQCADELACAVVSPVNHSCGCIHIEPSFLRRLRELCTEHGVVLMFDEVLTGFRHSVNGAQALVGVTPDLAAFGKAMANGFAIACLAGREDLMRQLSPTGPSFYSGTYNAHLVSVAAAQATIAELERLGVHQHLFDLGEYAQSEINQAIEDNQIEAVCQRFGSVYCLFLGIRHVREWRDVAALTHSGSDVRSGPAINRKFQQALLAAGIFMHPYSFNRSFLSAAHTKEDVARIIEATVEFMRQHRDEINRLSSAPAEGLSA